MLYLLIISFYCWVWLHQVTIPWLLIDIAYFQFRALCYYEWAHTGLCMIIFVLILFLPGTVFIQEQIPLSYHSDLEDFLIALSVFLLVNILQLSLVGFLWPRPSIVLKRSPSVIILECNLNSVKSQLLIATVFSHFRYQGAVCIYLFFYFLNY